jgi:hypothetical protein
MHYITRRLSPSLIVALMALFLALAGTAAANSVLGSNDVQGKSTPAAGAAQRSLAAAGCETGNVLGFARVKGMGSIPSFYTKDSALVDFAHSCGVAGASGVVVRRASAGIYFVKFLNNPAALALVTANEDGATSTLGGDTDNVVTVGKINSGPDEGSFRVDVLDIDAHKSQDAQFTIMTP